ncbi:MAG: hypothetical protein LBG52_08505 [Candidatus Peribacteria bacterium]|nr:hypothetical protein [Candidatus Peribacteria bacterium]
MGGDFSASYYDGTCRPTGMTTGDLETRTSSDHSSASETGSASSAPSSGTDEYLTAYQWAKKF